MWVAFKLQKQLRFKRLTGHIDISDVHQQQLLLARVVAALVDGVAGHLSGCNAQGFGYQCRQSVARVVERELEFGQANHGNWVLSWICFSDLTRHFSLERRVRPIIRV